MSSIVFHITENETDAQIACMAEELLHALPAIHEALLGALSKTVSTQAAISLSFIAFLSALDKMNVPQRVVLRALDDAVKVRKEVCGA